MKLALMVSMLMTSLALNAQTLQGKVVRVADVDTITILDETRVKKIGLWIYAPEKSQTYGEVSRKHLAESMLQPTSARSSRQLSRIIRKSPK